MSNGSKALMVIGSPKPGKSASRTFATYISDQLRDAGLEVEMVVVNKALRSEEGVRCLLSSFDEGSVIVVCFPLYIDSLPAGLTKAFEVVADHRRACPIDRKQRMMAVCQNGFPEQHQNETALSICRLFAQHIGIDWAGGLAFGGGGPLEGQDLKKMGWVVRNMTKALNIACSDLIAGRPLSTDAVMLMAKPIMPKWLYLVVGTFGWKQQAKKNRVFDKLRNRPYQV